MNTKTTSAPSIGTAATVQVGSDRYPATVVGVTASGKTVTIQYDSYTRTDKNGQSEAQEYTYSPNPNGNVSMVRVTRHGWRIGGQRGTLVVFGYRQAYQDPSF